MDEAKRLQALMAELRALLLEEYHIQHGIQTTDLGGLKLVRWDVPNSLYRCLYEPMINIILQGEKHSTIGTQKVHYGAGQCLIASVDLPSVSYLTDISPEHPFLSLSLPIDYYMLADIAARLPPSREKPSNLEAGMTVAPTDAFILEALLRLLHLNRRPEEKQFMTSLIIRELHYRLLSGPLGKELRRIITLGSHSNQIMQAVVYLKQHYKESLTVDQLAAIAHMGNSTFRRCFKRVTTLSPLQYQKRLQLHEAQRLMLAEGQSAAGAAYAVGYESATQFNREYKRLFGLPPAADINRLRSSEG